MPTHLGGPELLIILGIVVLLFGVGRIGKIAGELGHGIRSFKQGLQGDKDEKDETKEGTVDEEKVETVRKE